MRVKIENVQQYYVYTLVSHLYRNIDQMILYYFNVSFVMSCEYPRNLRFTISQ